MEAVAETIAVRPVMHRVLVRIQDKVDQINGIFVPEETQIREQMGAQLGTIIKLGATAFDHARTSATDLGIEEYWPQVGDEVWLVKYAGVEKNEDGVFLRLVNDEDIIGVVSSPGNWAEYEEERMLRENQAMRSEDVPQ